MSATTVTTIEMNRPSVPMARLLKVELRKMFDTRSGFWLAMSIAIVALLATIGVILIVNGEDLSYGIFGAAIGVPMAVILPIIAILAVTAEWSQRTGLTSFTLVPNRAQIIGAKALAAIVVGVVGVVVAFAIGALGNLLGSMIAGVDPVWDTSFADFVTIIFANVLGLLIGFMLGVLIRNSAGAIVGYFVYSFVLPTILGILEATQDWFKDIRPWVDFNYAQGTLFDDPSGSDWAHLGVSSVFWLVIPMAVGIWVVLRSEVK